MVTISMKRSLAITTLSGFLLTGEGQRMVRKRAVSPMIEIEDIKVFSFSNDRSPPLNRKAGDNKRRSMNRRLGSTRGLQKEETQNERMVFQFESEKLGKIERTLVGGVHDLKSENEKDGTWMDEYFGTLVRMGGVQMSMSSSPIAKPTKKPAPTKKPSNVNNPSRIPIATPTPLPTPEMAIPTQPPVAASIALVPAPTNVSGCESMPREEVLKESLQKVTTTSTLDDFSTPQGKAFVWLLDRDRAQIDPCNYKTVEQRYALATFFYSTVGGGWGNSDGWLTNPNECSWYGIKCNENGLVKELGANGALVANNLSGVLPQEIKVFEALESIQIGQNGISGSIPDVLTELTLLRLFDAEINSLSGPAVVSLKGLNKIESYRVSANRFSGNIDPSIGDTTSLRELWMADNQITGTIPESFGKLVNMETLYIYRNNLVGNLPAAFGQMKNLQELQVFQNFLSGTVPEDLYGNTELELVRLDRNQLTGTVSESIGNLSKLRDFRIDENLFTGQLPASFMNLSRLVVLRVNDNNFVGTIRDGFDLWKNLDFADFRNNGFDGTLPASIFDIPTIRILYFANNNFDGTMPSNYGTSPVLRDLFLSGNQLSGTIPDIKVGQLTVLTELLLEDNKFTGTMAESICNLRTAGQGLLEDLWVDCGEDANPRLECDAPRCCTACFPSSL